jgi:hypothetical protein
MYIASRDPTSPRADQASRHQDIKVPESDRELGAGSPSAVASRLPGLVVPQCGVAESLVNLLGCADNFARLAAGIGFGTLVIQKSWESTVLCWAGLGLSLEYLGDKVGSEKSQGAEYLCQAGLGLGARLSFGS